MAGHDGLEHGRLGELLGLGFDHQHGVASSRDDEVERGVFNSSSAGLIFSVPSMIADARGADWPHEGNARQGQRRRTRDHGNNIGIVLEIMREHRRDNLRLVAITVRKQRADRAVDQA